MDPFLPTHRPASIYISVDSPFAGPRQYCDSVPPSSRNTVNPGRGAMISLMAHDSPDDASGRHLEACSKDGNLISSGIIFTDV